MKSPRSSVVGMMSPRRSFRPKSQERPRKYVRISTCHDFQWSRGLWREASQRISFTASVCFMGYVCAASLLAYLDGVRGVDIPYFIAACVTTVGLGDIAPESQLHRAATVLVLPFGLMIISLCLAAVQARAKASSPHGSEAEDFDELGGEGNNSAASIRSQRSLKMMEQWYKLKSHRSAYMRQKLATISLQYLLTLGVGCSFFLVFARERRLQEQRNDEDMTVIDALYFASLVATSVGYGHRIVPQTIAAKGFLAFYFFSTVVVGAIVRKLVTITFKHNENLVEDEIVRATTWVHKTALLTDRPDEVTEADYLIFKLMQLQRVDEDILHRLQERFDELDNDLVGCLEVGEEIPSAQHIKSMEQAAEDAGVEADEDWFHDQWYAMRKGELERRDTLKKAQDAQEQKKEEELEAISLPTLFPDSMGNLLLVNIDTECCSVSKEGNNLELHSSHPGFKPLKPALDAYFKTRARKGAHCGPELSPIAPLTLDAATRKVGGVPLDATLFAFAFPIQLDMNLIEVQSDGVNENTTDGGDGDNDDDGKNKNKNKNKNKDDPQAAARAKAKAADDLFLKDGPCLLPLGGAFVYFNKHRKVVAMNCLVGAPPEEERMSKRKAPVIRFGPPQNLPQVTQEALGHRLHPVTDPNLQSRGAVVFTWINKGEVLPGIPPLARGALAFILKGGRGVYFPISHYNSGVRLRMHEIHDFSYSRRLWLRVCNETLLRGALFLVLYLLVGHYAICRAEGWDSATSWYFLSITFTTVGYGDFAPTMQSTRAIAIGLLPLGLVVVGFAISASQAYALSKPLKAIEDPFAAMLKILDPKKKQKALEKLVFDEAALFDVDDDGKITREELVSMAAALDLTPTQASELFDKLDTQGKGYILRKEDVPGFFSTIPGRIIILCFKVYYPVLIAAAFFKIPALRNLLISSGRQRDDHMDLTWIDSLYFSTVTVTTVGFGDITPETSGGRIFIAVYIIGTAVWVASVLGQFDDLYVNDYIGESIIAQIIDSTTFVHKSDIAGNGKVSMPEYLLFKLQELQMVDMKILDILSARFDELDRDNNLRLTIGKDVPSAEQVAKLKDELKWWNPRSRTEMDAWEVMQENIFAQISQKEKFEEMRKQWIDVEEKEDDEDREGQQHLKGRNENNRARPPPSSCYPAAAAATAAQPALSPPQAQTPQTPYSPPAAPPTPPLWPLEEGRKQKKPFFDDDDDDDGGDDDKNDNANTFVQKKKKNKAKDKNTPLTTTATSNIANAYRASHNSSASASKAKKASTTATKKASTTTAALPPSSSSERQESRSRIPSKGGGSLSSYKPPPSPVGVGSVRSGSAASSSAPPSHISQASLRGAQFVEEEGTKRRSPEDNDNDNGNQEEPAAAAAFFGRSGIPSSSSGGGGELENRMIPISPAPDFRAGLV